MSPRDDFRLKSRVFDWQNTSLYNDVIFVYEVLAAHEARLAPEIVAFGLKCFVLKQYFVVCLVLRRDKNYM